MAAQQRMATAVSLIASPVLLMIALAVAGLSVRALVLFAAHADVFDTAAAIEKGARPDADYLARFVSLAGLDRASVDCGDAYTRASLTVNLAALAAAVDANDAALIDAAERNAVRAAERRLACNPLDGNAWLRYAMVEFRGKGPATSVIEALRASYRTAPSEGWIIEPRLAFATQLYLTGVTAFSAEYSGDLGRFVSFELTNRVAAAYVATNSQVRARLRRPIDEQPEARKKAIVAEIDRLGLDYRREAQ